MSHLFRCCLILAMVVFGSSLSPAAAESPPAAKQKTLNVLFIGNSFTGRHNLSQVVKAMAEAGNRTLRFNTRPGSPG